MGEEPPKYQVEDVLNKKKPPPQILDLNGIVIETEDEFKTTMEKIPDYRIREEDDRETDDAVKNLCSTMRHHRLTKKQLYTQAAIYAKPCTEVINVSDPAESGINLSQSCHDRAHTDGVPQKPTQDDKEKENSFPCTTTRRQESRQKSITAEEEKKSEAGTQDGGSGRTTSRVGQVQGQNIIVPPPPFQFSDPCPQSMRHVRIGELSSVDINWKMLTLARPTSKIDEDIFSKLVELDKLRLATRKEESKELAGKGGVDPYVVVMPPSASKGGVSEKLIKVCEECREEFCCGTCIIFQLIKENGEDDLDNPEEAAKKKKKRTKSAKKKK